MNTMVNIVVSCFDLFLLVVLAIFTIGLSKNVTNYGTLLFNFFGSTILLRDIDLMTQSSPVAARFAPNGKLFTAIVFFDFNSMYLWSQLQVQPLTPGLRWVKNGTRFQKRILSPNGSFEALQYIYYCQAVLEKTNPGLNIEHQYFHGEKTVYGHKVDGYVKIDGKEIVFEYNGKYLVPVLLPNYNQCVKDATITGVNVYQI